MRIKDHWYKVSRLGGLRRFAVAITVLNVLGHTFLGFEQSPAQPLVALGVTYGMALLLEWIEARLQGRPPRFAGGLRALVDFLLPAHITGLAVAMLLYANDQLWPIAFAAAAAMGSKTLFRARVGKGARHFFNPSNFGISAVLILFPWVGIAPPYHFTENLFGPANWVLPGIIVLSGTYLNARFTRRLPLIAAWLGGFVAQALARNLFFGTEVLAGLMPLTGMAFLLFTFYMITDPATTPGEVRSQVLFGGAVSLVYAVLMMAHIVFGLFFSLTVVCVFRGILLHVQEARARRTIEPVAVPVPIVAPPGPSWTLLNARVREREPEPEL